MKLTVGNKDLANALKLHKANVNKKSLMDKVVFKATPYNTLEIVSINADFTMLGLTTNIDCNVEVGGEVAISIEDVEIVLKQKKDIVIETTDEGKVTFMVGKKKLTFNTFENDYLEMLKEKFPRCNHIKGMEDTTKTFAEITKDLKNFVSYEQNNRMLQVMSADSKHGIVALDGHRIGVKKIEVENNFLITPTTFKLFPLLEKVSDRIKVCISDKYITYLTTDGKVYIKAEKFEGDYFNVNAFLNAEYSNKFTINDTHLKEVITDAIDCVKSNSNKKLPMVMKMNFKDGIIKTKVTSRYEVADEISIENIDSKKSDMLVGFNPFFLKDVMEVIKYSECDCSMEAPNNPLAIETNNYKFLVLPVRIASEDCVGM